jgi:ComEC/Rec2-related protein
MLATVRSHLREKIDSLFDRKPNIAGILRAMLLGDRTFVDRDQATDFQKTGVFHVLVVAGFHVGALAAMLFWFSRKIRLSSTWTILLTAVVLAAYVAVVEQRPPVLRAALMIAAVMLGGFFYRRIDLLNSAAVAALVLLVARPLLLRDSSFQLSFVAIGCIAGLALPWLTRTAQPYAGAMRGWQDVTRDVAHELRAAQFRIDVRATAKWIAARLPQRLANESHNGVAGALVFTFRAWELLVLTIVLQIGMLPLMASNFHRVTLASPLVNLVAVPVTAAIVIAFFPFSPEWSPGKLEATILDVGQGDSIFIVSPQGRTLLIDGGGAFRGFPGHEEHSSIDPGEDAVSPYLWSRGYQQLDVVALTHAHQDHLGGLVAVLENFRVGRLWIGREAISPALAALEATARAKHILIEHETSGRQFSWSGTDAKFFWPSTETSEAAGPAKNNDSLVLRLRYGSRTVLLPGDAEKDVERTWLSDGSDQELQADVLKVGNHGSENSTTPDFLAAVRPKIAIISAGEENPYGHPSPVLLERLESAGTRALRTDLDGSVTVLTDGDKIDVHCFVACPEPIASEALRQPQSPDHD